MFCIHQPIPKVLIFSSVELWPWILLWIIFNVPQPQLKKQVFQKSPWTWLLVSYRKIKKLSLKVLGYIEIWTKVFCLHYILVNLTNDLFMVFLRIIKKHEITQGRFLDLPQRRIFVIFDNKSFLSKFIWLRRNFIFDRISRWEIFLSG